MKIPYKALSADEIYEIRQYVDKKEIESFTPHSISWRELTLCGGIILFVFLFVVFVSALIQ